MWCCGRAASIPRCFIRASTDLCLPAPVFLSVGRVAVEKNLEAFLDLDLPGTKVVVGDGPARAALERKYPRRGVSRRAARRGTGGDLRRAPTCFVFPSKTDTFGLVLLEALASGLPVAAFPVTGPRDVIGTAPVGVLERRSARGLPGSAGDSARRPASSSPPGHTWQASARVFVDHAPNVRPVEPEAEPSDAAEFRGGRPAFRGLISR